MRKDKMKINKLTIPVTVGALCLALAGCGKQDTSDSTTTTSVPTKTAPDTKPAASAAVDQAKDAAQTAATETKQATEKAATEVKQATDTAATDAKQAAEKATAETSQQAQSLIDKAKGLLTEKNYKEAVNVLQQLKTLKLTPE